MTVVWTEGIAVTGEGTIPGASGLLRVDVTATFANASYADTTPPRYFNLGTIGEYAGSYRNVGERIIYAKQQFASDLDESDGWYYVLPAGVVATIYRGVDVSTEMPIAAKVRRSTNQTIANNTDTALSFDAEVFDPFGLHSPATNPTRITVNTPGWYMVGALVGLTVNVAARVSVSIRKNGTDEICGNVSFVDAGGGSTEVGVAGGEYLNVGDYIEAYVYQTSGGSRDVYTYSTTNPTFWAARVG